MSRQRRSFSAKFKSDLVIELLKGCLLYTSYRGTARGSRVKKRETKDRCMTLIRSNLKTKNLLIIFKFGDILFAARIY